MKKALTLVEVLIAVAILGVFFMMTLPVLNQSGNQKEIMAGFRNFNEGLQNAVQSWKKNNLCPYKASMCIDLQNVTNMFPPIYTQLETYMNTPDKVTGNPDLYQYLPARTLNYYGNKVSEYDFRTNKQRVVYILPNGIVFSVLSEKEGCWLIVDVNGKRMPNRIGYDTYHFVIGYDTPNDVSFYPKIKTSDGLCGGIGENFTCVPDNLDPRVKGGACPTSYVATTNKVPDFSVLAQSIEGFRP